MFKLRLKEDFYAAGGVFVGASLRTTCDTTCIKRKGKALNKTNKFPSHTNLG